MCNKHSNQTHADHQKTSEDKPHVCCGRCNGEGKRLGGQPVDDAQLQATAVPIRFIAKLASKQNKD